MIKRLPFPKIKQKDRNKALLDEWVWNSHYWIEYSYGYCKCKYCGAIWTSEMSLDSNVKLCKKNPRLKELIKKGE